MRATLLTNAAISFVMMVLIAAGSACANRRAETRISPKVGSAARSYPGNALMADELATASGSTAYDAIRQLRPFFLHSHGLRPPVVHVDYSLRASLDVLQTVPISSIREIRYLDVRAATIQFGAGYSGGAILVSTRSGPR